MVAWHQKSDAAISYGLLIVIKKQKHYIRDILKFDPYLDLFGRHLGYFFDKMYTTCRPKLAKCIPFFVVGGLSFSSIIKAPMGGVNG